MGKIMYEGDTPLYLQIYNNLLYEIEIGEYSPGERIPSEESLRFKYHVSRVTIRAALSKMVDDGILVKKRGKGTFVAQHAFLESGKAQGSFTKSCKQKGVRPATKLIYSGIIKTFLPVSDFLQISDESEMVCVKRIRMIDDIPVIFEEDYFSKEHSYILNADVENCPIREIIKKNSGLNVSRYMDTFDVRLADKEQSKWLECQLDTPLLGIQQLVYNEHNQILYYNEQYIKSEIYKYVSEQYFRINQEV